MNRMRNHRVPTGEVELRPWSGRDLPLLRRANSESPHPEPEARTFRRHSRFLDDVRDSTAFPFAAVVDGEAVGIAGYGYGSWRGIAVFEARWQVLTEHRGRGFERDILRAIQSHATAAPVPRHLMVRTARTDIESAEFCRSLGFEQHEEDGGPSVWLYDLEAAAASAAAA